MSFLITRARNYLLLLKISVDFAPTQIHSHNEGIKTYDFSLLISWHFLEHDKYSKNLKNKPMDEWFPCLGNDCTVAWLDG